MPSRRAALIAFALFVVLGGVVYFTVGRAPQAAAWPTQESKPLLPLGGAQVSRVEVHSAGKEGYLVLTKDQSGQWQIEQPVQALADQDTVAGIIDGLSQFQVLRALEPGTATPSEFGLEPPQFTVQLQASDGGLYTLEVGSYNLDSTKRYVRLQGKDEVYLVYPYQLDRLNGMIDAPPLPPTPTPQPTAPSTAGTEEVPTAANP